MGHGSDTLTPGQRTEILLLGRANEPTLGEEATIDNGAGGQTRRDLPRGFALGKWYAMQFSLAQHSYPLF